MRTTIDHLYMDIWLQIFEYFNAIELFTSFTHVTRTIDDLLFKRNQHFVLRQLILDVHVKSLPEKLLLSQVVSLELHQDNYLNIIDQCLELRSIKLIGQSEWTIGLLKKLSHINKKLQQLILVIPGISMLHEILASISQIPSFCRLEIYANQSEEKIKTSSYFLLQTNIERFVLDSCSPIDMHELSFILSSLPNIRSLHVNLFYCKRSCFTSCNFTSLCYMRLMLVEVSFECIIQLITKTPALVKLKLNGLIDGEGFIVNHKWIDLFQLCPSRVMIVVNTSLENGTYCFFSEMIQESLREINLNLRPLDDDCDHYLSEINHQRWWKLAGIIMRHHIHV